MPAVAQVLQMEQGSAAFGSQVAGVGDVNGDGFGDLLVGAPGCDQGHTDEGCAYLYFGSPAGFPASPSWSAEGDAAGLGFGAGVAAAGDVDGDGYDDILILASGYGKGHIQEGRVFLYLGSATGPGSREDWKMETNVDNAGPSLSLAGSADLNNDGYAEILIGNPLFSNGQASEGGVMIYTGSDTGPGRDPTWVLESNVENAYFGSAVAAAGDVNGDNYGDVIIGAPAYYASGFNRGAALLFQGSASGPGSAADWIYWNMTGLPFSAYASQVAGAGDVNGDGYDDVIVGTPGYTNSEIIHIGLVDYFPGSDTGLPPAPAWSLSSTVQHDQWGLALCGIGDMNGDGYDDILFTGQPVMGLSGQAFLHLGSADGPQDLPSWQHASPPNEDRYGDTVSGLGDVDGDGLLDWAVGAPMADEPDVDEGKAVVYRACTETDLDGVCDSLDNCVTTVNAGQENGDDDARGDACDCAAGDPGLWSVPG
ncbi:MAG: hypothetical protein GWM87_05980, partial [Xanthomonadales bacterium]|nr:hypothetical protein [Xanthomonadales bacterium]NIX12526.1 hypothetical protein [Xanthomonadales bacterium]